MILRIGDAAAAEALDAARWYEAHRPGLGDEFIAAVMAAGAQIAANPTAWPVWQPRAGRPIPIRRYVIQRFPFALLYQVLEDAIEIVAIAHSRRRPGYWRGRTGR